MRRVGLKLAFGLVLLSVVGCDCGSPPAERELFIRYVKPTDGLQLTANDEVDAAAEGFQTHVDVEVVDQDGNPVEVEVEGGDRVRLETRPTTQAQFVRFEGEVQVDGNKVRFVGVTLPSGINLLKVFAKEKTTTLTKAHIITVKVGLDAQVVGLTCPAAGQILRAVDDANPDAPGYQVRFCVDAPGLAGSSGKVICDKVCGLSPSPFTLDGEGRASVELTLTDEACEAAAAECRAVVTNPQGQSFSSQVRSFTVDPMGPQVEIASPFRPVTATSFNVDAVVGCAEDGTLATLKADGSGAVLTAQVSAGVVTFPGVSVLGDGTYGYTLSVSDSAGNVTEKRLNATVAATAPSLSVVAPTTVTNDSNATASDGVQTIVTASVNSEPVGTEVRYWTSVTGSLGQARTAVTSQIGSDRVASFEVDLAEGANTLKVCARNAAGLETCDLKVITVSTGRPTCRITSPADSEVKRLTSALSIQVQANAGNVTVTAIDSGGTPTTSAPAAVTGGVANASLALPQDGPYRLIASCPGGGVSQQLWFKQDGVAPNIGAVVVRGAGGLTHLGPKVADTSTLPGRQIIVEVTTERDAAVSATGCAMIAPSHATANALGVAVLRDIAVPENGTCTVAIRARDAAGNESQHDLPLTLSFTGASLSWVDPQPGAVLSAGDGVPISGGGLTVPVTVSFTAVAEAGTLQLLRDGVEVDSVAVAPGDTTQTFASVDLAEGANFLQAVLTDAAGNVSCVVGLVFARTGLPGAITLLAPRTDVPELYRVAEDRDLNTPGMQRGLTYQLNGVAGAARVDICTNQPVGLLPTPCADGSGWFTLQQSVAPTNPNFTYPEGAYQLRAVLIDGSGSAQQSAIATMTVDSVRPRVTSVSFTGDANGDRRLNAVELPSGPPQALVVAQGLPDGSVVRVLDAGPAKTQYGSSTSTNGAALVTLTALPASPEANYALRVEVVDENGNPNKLDPPAAPLDPINTEALISLRVDRVAPLLSLVSPTKAFLSGADDADGNPGNGTFVLRLQLVTSADVTGASGVEVTRVGSPTRGYKPDGSLSVIDDHNLAASGTTAYTFQLRATDDSGNVTTLPDRVITVDLEAPVVSITAPAAGTYNSQSQTVEASVVGGEGLTARFYTTLSGYPEAQIGTATVTGGQAQLHHVFPEGTHTLRVEVTDLAGNTDDATQAGVVINVPGCALLVTRPANTHNTLNIASDEQGAAGLQYTVEGVTNDPNCHGETVSFYSGMPPTTPIGTTTAHPSTGEFSFLLNLADGTQTQIRAEMDDGNGNLSSVTFNVLVDVTAPSLSALSPAQTTLYFVADSNRFLGQPGYVMDLVADGDAQANLSFTVTGANGGTARVRYQGNDLVPPISIDADPKAVSLPSVTLPQGSTGALQIQVTDAAGNPTTHTANVTVDVQPPSAPTVSTHIATGDHRRARLNVSWNQVYDDLSNAGSGLPTSIDLRWTTNAVLSDGITSETEFFDPALTRQPGGALLPGSALAQTLDKLPPLAKYFLRVRAVDEVGNYSRFAERPQTQHDNFWQVAAFNNPGSGQFAAEIASAGDLNKDGRHDLLVSANSLSDNADTPGKVFVVYGSANLANPTVQTISNSSLVPTGSERYSFDVAMGNVSHPPSDNLVDLLIANPAWSSSRGRVFLHFGVPSGQVSGSTFIDFRGNPGSELGRVAQVLPDINNDGLGEVVLTAHAEDSHRGRVYIFYGRSRSAWETLQSANGGSVPMSAADKVIEGPSPLPPGLTIQQFGRGRGFAALGDIDADAHGDFTVPMSQGSINKLFLFSGQAVKNKAGSVLTGIAPGIVDDALQTLTRPPFNATTTNMQGVGWRALGGVNLVGGPAPDLVVSYPLISQVLIYADATSAGYAGAPMVLQGAVSTNFGYTLNRGDLNGDGLQDLVIGQNLTGGNNSAWVFYNTGVLGSEFDLIAGAGFNQSRLTSPTKLGISTAVGDFNGDGATDVAVADDTDGTPPNAGKVFIWH